MTVNTQTSIPTTATDAAIAELKYLLDTFGYKNINLYIKGDMIYVEFNEKPALTDEQIKKIRNVFYWTDTVDVPFITGLVHYYDFSATLLISIRNYDKIVAVRDFIVSSGMQLLAFDICDYEFSFRYDWSNRDRFNYDELETVRKMIDPTGEHPRSVIIYGGERIHSMSVRP